MAVEEIDKENETGRNPSMAKSDHEREAEDDGKNSPPETAAVAWGTWEELLLASAVNRYGTKSWDSISSEIRKRSSAPIRLTPHHCEQKYRELKRRFNESEDNDVVDDGSVTTTTTTATTGNTTAATATTTTAAAIPWLEELRKLRVLELQRELQNYDLYISSLQLKVKKLTEESEKTDGETKNTSDLGHRTEEIELDATPEPVVSGDDDSDTDRDDNQSVNGSNGNLETGVEKSENGNEISPVTGDTNTNNTNTKKPDSGSVPVLPVRDDGGPEVKEPVKTEPDGEASEAPESIAESKSEGKNSDVQSSASKSRKERRDRVPRGVKGDDRENEDQSTDSIPVRSLPLVDFLQKLHKLGSAVFERRLDRQEKVRYRNLVRQHIDYDTLQTRLKEGWYSDGNDKFFRDLLLLVNNTRVFFPKQSPESTAAVDLRQFILKEMISKKKQKTLSKPANLPSKRSADTPDSLLLKPKLAGSIVVCRKRSSIAAKAAGSSSGKKEPTDSKDSKGSEKVTEENPSSSKKSRDSFPSGSKKKGKSPVTESSDFKTDVSKTNLSKTDVAKTETKRKLTEAEEKKQSAAKFLNRMKRSNEPMMTMSERDEGEDTESDSEGNEPKKSGSNKGGGGGGSGSGGGGGDGKRDNKKSSSGRGGKEQGSPAKRSVGRPPKRAVTQPSLAGLGKRNRDPVDPETLGSKQTKKRSKR